MELQNIPPEDQKVMQERLKNMSPEELREFQKQQCLFCQIIHGKVNARRVYDDDKVVAVLDINPATLGHVLLMPREHYQILPQMNDDEVSYLFNISKGISGATLRAFQVQGTNIFVANGAVAGQRAAHVIVHIIPRSENDRVNLTIPEFQISEQNMVLVHKRILEFMTSALAMAPEEDVAVAEKQEIKTEEPKAEIQTEIKSEKVEQKAPKKEKIVEAELKEAKQKKERKKTASRSKGSSLDDLAERL